MQQIESTPEIKKTIPLTLVITFISFLVAIIIGGIFFYKSQRIRIFTENQNNLTAISILKIRQIEQWHIERLGNAEQIRNNNPLLKSLKDFILNANQPIVEADIKKWTDYAAQRLDYTGVFIYDTLLNSRLDATRSVSILPEATRIVCMEVLKDMNVRMTDLYRNELSSQPAIDIVIPLVLDNKKQSKPFGLIILRIDPAKTLYPLIQSWPTPSRSAETLIIRREGDSVLYLNDLRHIQNTALNLKLPISDSNLPAVKAVNGFVGVVEGVDYRNVPVVGYVSSIPGLNWFIVAKIDKKELEQPLTRWTIISVIVTLLLLFLIAAVLFSWIRNQQYIYSKELLRMELDKKQLYETIREWNNNFKKLSSNAPGMIYQFTRRLDGTFYVPIASEGIRNIYGCSPEDVLNDFSPIAKVILPEDLERVVSDIEYSADHLTIFNCDYRVQLPGEPVKWLSSNSTPEKLDDGTTTWYGFNSDITKQKLAQDELRETNEYLSSLFNYANAPIIVWDNSLLITKFNHAFENLSGFFEEEVLGKRIDFLFPEDKVESSLKMINRAVLGERWETVEIEIKRKDGGSRVVLWNSANILGRDSKTVVATIAQGNDITERKLAETKLSEEKERISTILDQVGDPIFVKDNDHRIILANQAFYDIFCMEEKSVIGYTLAEAVPESERHQFLKVDREVLDTGITDVREEELTVNDFTRTIITRKIRFIDESGNRFLVGSIHDITDRKKMENELHESETQFRQTFEYSPLGIVMVGLDKRFIHCNDPFAQLLGYSVEELIGKSIIDITYPDDQLLGMNEMIAIAQGELKISQIQKRYLRKDGKILLGDVTISLVSDNEGNPRYFLAIIQDITQRKLAEEKIKSQVDELARFNKIMVGRENRMIELKQEINELCGKLDLPLRYKAPDEANKDKRQKSQDKRKVK